jgi:uncharacterized protein
VSGEREDQNKQLIRQAFDDWANGKGGVFGLLAQDATWTIVGNTPISRVYQYRNDYTWYLDLADGQITNAVAFFDSIEFTDFWNRVPPSGM